MENWQEWLKPQVIWFILGIIMLLMEFAIPGLVIAFFGMGALVVAIVCMIWAPSLTVQLAIFILSSLVFILVLRRWLKTKFFGSDAADVAQAGVLDEFTGKRATVIAPIGPGKPGKVEFKGTGWTAESDEELAEGDAAIIVGKENISLTVRKA